MPILPTPISTFSPSGFPLPPPPPPPVNNLHFPSSSSSSYSLLHLAPFCLYVPSIWGIHLLKVPTTYMLSDTQKGRPFHFLQSTLGSNSIPKIKGPQLISVLFSSSHVEQSRLSWVHEAISAFCSRQDIIKTHFTFLNNVIILHYLVLLFIVTERKLIWVASSKHESIIAGFT